MKNYEVVFTALKKVELLECPVPQPGPGEFLAKTIVSQISIGTELTSLEGNVEEGSLWLKEISFPRRPGYSVVGEIIAVGEGVDPNLVGKRFHGSAKHVKYFTMKVDDTNRYRFLPEGVAPEAAVFSTMGNITMASIRMSQLRPGDVVAVFGAGVIGQMLARLAIICGAAKVFVCDVSDLRLSKLPEHPGIIAINSTKEEIKDVVMANNDGRLADIAFEATSVGMLAQKELESLAPFGKLIVTSNPKGRSTVDLDLCNRRCITICGVHNPLFHRSGGTPANRWTSGMDNILMLEMMRQKRLTTTEMITHEVNYKDAVATYEMLMEDRTRALGVNLLWND